jgi:hypothetical protein
MQDVAMRRRIAALVLAALLAISGAALATAYFAADEQAAIKGITEFEAYGNVSEGPRLSAALALLLALFTEVRGRVILGSRTAAKRRSPKSVYRILHSPGPIRRSQRGIKLHGRPPLCCGRPDPARRLRSTRAGSPPRAGPAPRCRCPPPARRRRGKTRPRPGSWPRRRHAD